MRSAGSPGQVGERREPRRGRQGGDGLAGQLEGGAVGLVEPLAEGDALRAGSAGEMTDQTAAS